jgi:hypothetical protein
LSLDDQSLLFGDEALGADRHVISNARDPTRLGELLEKLAAGELERSQFQCIESVISQLRTTIAKRLIDLTGPGGNRPSLTASQRERYAYYGRAARTSLELSDKVHD